MPGRRHACAALLIALALLRPGLAAALEDTRLAWGRHDTNLHLGAAFAGSLAGTELLRWWGWSKPKATLASSLAVAAAGVFKEFVVDAAPSGSDLMADGVGIGAHAAFQFTVRFDWPWGARPNRPAGEMVSSPTER
ncbi:MAG: hypothetical protein HY927_04220 [Elusimicrobia bacterium]|nr:hypothetical protein [Elusimicrobiota bacterium]